MKGKGVAICRAAGALGLTLALVVGVPVLLVALVGNPFPESLPSLDEIRILLTQTGQGFANLIIGTLAVLIWFMWAQLVLALGVEIVATVRQSETRRLQTIPGIQAFAARLVAAMTLAAALAAGPLLAPAVGALNLGEAASYESAPVEQIRVDADATSVGRLRLTADEAKVADDEISILLDDQTELWDVADSAYGDGLSWKLIAQANAGLADAAGEMITTETAMVGPGTELRLPGTVDAVALARHGMVKGISDTGQLEAARHTVAINRRSTSATPPSDEAVHIVQSGDSMWTVAEQAVEARSDHDPSLSEVAAYWSDVVDANQDMPSGNVDLIYPGDELNLPHVEDGFTDSAQREHAATDQGPAAEADGAVELETPVVETDPALLTEPVADGPAVNRNALDAPETRDAAAQDSAAQDSATQDSVTAGESESLPLVVPATAAETSVPEPKIETPPAQETATRRAVGLSAFGAAVLAAGVVGALRRRRDRQRRTRPETLIARRASSNAEAFEAALQQSSSELRDSDIGAGWRMMPAHAVAAARRAGPIEFHAEESGRLHAVAVVGEGDMAEVRRVELNAKTDTAEVERELGLPVTEEGVGRGEPGIAVIPTSLVLGTDVVSGQAVLLDLQSAGSLALAGTNDAVLRVCRSAVLDLAVSERADDLCLIAIGFGAELGDLDRVRLAQSFPDALDQARSCTHTSPDSTTPVVVISAQPPGDQMSSATSLVDLGVLVVAPEIDSPARLVIEGGTATLSPAGTVIDLAGFEEADYRSVAELIETTAPNAVEPLSDAMAIDVLTDVLGVEALTADSCGIEAGAIEVKVLGPVEVAGAAAFSSLKAVDVIAYLAFHRNGADADQIKSWVWPAYQPPTDKAFANVLSRARAGLGLGEDGAPLLSRAGADRTYRLSPEVTTDFDRFRAIVELAGSAESVNATVAILKRSLELIRGVPFTGGGASSFVWADNHVRAQVEFAIDETVHRCADLALEVGDLETARWAALKGLELVPGCEQCFRRRFLVAGAGQNRSELRRAMADLERSAAAELGEPEGVDLISGDLLELYHQLDQTLVAGSA